ncbi:hypothetical protein AB0H49_23340 [Nocardia sp. NPDC050713]|uniref:hypothetical protein n=1 Tax=Nocardia sp. NPDC050713 TaxID=3154511 RepID=UPI0033CCA8BB
MSEPKIPSQGLASIGIVVCDDIVGVPSPLVAMQIVDGGETTPSHEVSYPSSTALDELDAFWNVEASEMGLIDEAGRFLLALPGPGSSRKGWICAQGATENLPSRIERVTGSIELIAMSTDGLRICATSKEERHYWVVSYTFSKPLQTCSRRTGEIYPEARRLAAGGSTLSEFLSYLRSTREFRVSKMEFMRILKEACGILPSNVRDLGALMDQDCKPTVPAEELESKWRQLVVRHLQRVDGNE